MDEEVHMARRVFISFRFSFVSYLMERRKLLIVQKMKIDQECQKKQYKNICILN